MDAQELELFQALIHLVKDTPATIIELKKIIEQVQKAVENLPSKDQTEAIKVLLNDIIKLQQKIAEFNIQLGDPSNLLEKVNTIARKVESSDSMVGCMDKLKTFIDDMYNVVNESLATKITDTEKKVDFIYEWSRIKLPLIVGLITLLFTFFSYFFTMVQVNNVVTDSLKPIAVQVNDTSKALGEIEKYIKTKGEPKNGPY